MSDTPMDPGTRLPSSDAELAENFTKPYQSLVGALSYLAHCSRPDLSFAVHQLSMHMQKPGIVHWKALERVLSYLKRHPKLSITYSKPVDKKMHIYSDSDWGGDNNDYHSTSGYACILNQGIVSWSVKKQDTIARSSTEAEYVAIDHGSRQLIFLKSLCEELGVDLQQPVLMVDNEGARKLALNPVMHQRTKHIAIKYHAIREMLMDKVMTIEHVGTEDMLADPFTKAVSFPKLSKAIRAWGMCPLRGGVGFKEQS